MIARSGETDLWRFELRATPAERLIEAGYFGVNPVWRHVKSLRHGVGPADPQRPDRHPRGPDRAYGRAPPDDVCPKARPGSVDALQLPRHHRHVRDGLPVQRRLGRAAGYEREVFDRNARAPGTLRLVLSSGIRGAGSKTTARPRQRLYHIRFAEQADQAFSADDHPLGENPSCRSELLAVASGHRRRAGQPRSSRSLCRTRHWSGSFALHGQASAVSYLDLYNLADIALDPFPYNGGITSCDAMWMGVRWWDWREIPTTPGKA